MTQVCIDMDRVLFLEREKFLNDFLDYISEHKKDEYQCFNEKELQRLKREFFGEE